MAVLFSYLGFHMKQLKVYRIEHQKTMQTGDYYTVHNSFLSAEACVVAIGAVSVVQAMAGKVDLVAIILTPVAVNHYPLHC